MWGGMIRPQYYVELLNPKPIGFFQPFIYPTQYQFVCRLSLSVRLLVDNINKLCLYSTVTTEIDQNGVGELNAIVKNDNSLKTKHEHNLLPIETLKSFCCDLGDDFFFYLFCKITHSHGQEFQLVMHQRKMT